MTGSNPASASTQVCVCVCVHYLWKRLLRNSAQPVDFSVVSRDVLHYTMLFLLTGDFRLVVTDNDVVYKWVHDALRS